MAADVKKIIRDLLEFYSFKGKTVVSVGAGGGQLVEYGRSADKVIAIDCDQTALVRLKSNLQKLELDDKFTLIHSDFYCSDVRGDVVLFEFCLHEMEDAKRAIDHALTIAPIVVVIDHWKGSEWAYVVDEDEKVAKSWQSFESYSPEVQVCESDQCFADYDELYQKVKVQGCRSIERISIFKQRTNFVIPMSYGLALIHKG